MPLMHVARGAECLKLLAVHHAQRLKRHDKNSARHAKRGKKITFKMRSVRSHDDDLDYYPALP